MNEPKSVVRRVPVDKAIVLDFIASQKKWIPITAINEVIASSPLFIDGLRQYESAVADENR